MAEQQQIDQTIIPQTSLPDVSVTTSRINKKFWFLFGVLASIVIYISVYKIFGRDYLYNVGYLDFYPTIDSIFVFTAIPIGMLAVIIQGLAIAKGIGYEKRKRIFAPVASFIWGYLIGHILVYVSLYVYDLTTLLYIRQPDI